jgi:hypothetical protein
MPAALTLPVVAALGLGLLVGGPHGSPVTSPASIDLSVIPAIDCKLEYTPSAGKLQARAVCTDLPPGINVGVGPAPRISFEDVVWSEAGRTATDWTSWALYADEIELRYRADPTGYGSDCRAEHVKTNVVFGSDHHTVKLTCNSLLPHIKARGVLDVVGTNDLYTKWHVGSGTVESPRLTGGITREARVEYELNY